ncbi:hypothetical protein [Streptomyces pseudovenezuelae]|uniref:hypothetical protein n=1 Tax=Streptomyces pseudovenezuelae TaxID=67350 RepID=UPI0036E29BC3
MNEHRDHGDDLLQPGDYLTGDDAERAIPRITGIPRQGRAAAPLGKQAPRQRDRRAE